MKPSLGRIVLYTLTQSDADSINANRGEKFRGNPAAWGQLYPMVVIRVHSETCINGHVLLDGNDTYWVGQTTLVEDENYNGHWMWPIRE